MPVVVQRKALLGSSLHGMWFSGSRVTTCSSFGRLLLGTGVRRFPVCADCSGHAVRGCGGEASLRGVAYWRGQFLSRRFVPLIMEEIVPVEVRSCACRSFVVA